MVSRWLSGKESCQFRKHRFNPWMRMIPGEGNGSPLRYSCLGNPMGRGTGGLQSIGLQSRTWLSDWAYTCDGPTYPFLSFCDFQLAYIPRYFFWACQMALMVKNLPANAGDVRDMGLNPGSGRSPGGGHGNPLEYSCLENPLDRGVWQAIVYSVTKSWTRLKRLSMHGEREKWGGVSQRVKNFQL